MSSDALSTEKRVWIPVERIGQIEVRPYRFGDGMDPSISISAADKLLPSFEGGFIARNPDNHADQWYIAKDYFNKHYRIPVETGCAGCMHPSCRECWPHGYMKPPPPETRARTDRFTSLVPDAAKLAANSLHGAFLFHESREGEGYWNAVLDRLHELGSASKAREEPRALHLVMCCHDGCKDQMRLPYTDASRTAVSLLEAGNWFFSTDTGWLCPAHSPAPTRG